MRVDRSREEKRGDETQGAEMALEDGEVQGANTAC